MIEIKNLEVALGKNIIINNINLNIMDGEIVGIIGKAGTGKTVFLKAVANQLKFKKGEILYNTMAFPSFLKENINNRIIYFNGLLPDNMDDRVYNFLLLARAQYRKIFQSYSEYDIQVVEEYLNLFDLEQYREYSLGSLSDSIIQKVLLSFTFIQMAKFVLLDNPTNNLDVKSTSYLLRAISKYTINGDKSIIIASNDLNFISQTADKIVILNEEGTIAKDGNPEILTKQTVKDHFNTDVLISRNIYNGRPEVHYYSES